MFFCCCDVEELILPCLIPIQVMSMIGFASCRSGSWNTFSTAKTQVTPQMFLLLSNIKCHLQCTVCCILAQCILKIFFIKCIPQNVSKYISQMYSSKYVRCVSQNIFLKIGALHFGTMYSQDMFLKMYSSKMYFPKFSNVFLKMYFPNCIEISFKMPLLL